MVCVALLAARGSPLCQAGGHHRSLLVFHALMRHPPSGSRSWATQNGNTNQPKLVPGWEQGGGGDPLMVGQGMEPKNP